MNFLEIAVSLPIGVLGGYGAVAVLNRLPAGWLCDYGQAPSEELKSGARRVKYLPWAVIFSVVFAFAAAVILSANGYLYSTVSLFSLWFLMVIALADMKYMIIPDQFIALLALAALGLLPYHASLLSPLYGLLIGGGCMLLIGFAGKLIYKKESLGFGDVKLFAALGLLAGPMGVLMLIVVSSLLSAAVFTVGLLLKKIKRTDVVPIGPYAALAYFLHELFKSTI